MRKTTAFTLLELLVAISFSSLIVFSLSKIFLYTSTLFTKSNFRLEVDRRAVAIFEQLEKDYSSAFMIPLQKEIKEEKKKSEPNKEEQPSNQQSNLEKRKSEDEKKSSDDDKKPSDFFISTVQDTDVVQKKGTKKLQMFKTSNFLSSNTLNVENKPQQYLSRISYELFRDKEHKNGDKISYKLIRKETNDPQNKKLSADMDKFDKKNIYLSQYLISDFIKGIYFEFVAPKPKKDDKEAEQKTADGKPVMIRSFTWGEKKETKEILPQYINVRLILWDQKMESEYRYDTKIICLATAKLEKEDKNKKTLEEKPPQPEQPQPGKQGQIPPTPPGNSAGQPASTTK